MLADRPHALERLERSLYGDARGPLLGARQEKQLIHGLGIHDGVAWPEALGQVRRDGHHAIAGNDDP
jgi:hypothetical protein